MDDVEDNIMVTSYAFNIVVKYSLNHCINLRINYYMYYYESLTEHLTCTYLYALN